MSMMSPNYSFDLFLSYMKFYELPTKGSEYIANNHLV